MDDRLSEPIAQPAQRLRRSRKRLVELDRIDLLRDRHQRLEQRIEFGGHRRRLNDVTGGDPPDRVFRRRERHILVAEHRRRLDFGIDVLRDQVDVLRLDIQRQLRPRFVADVDLGDVGDPADHHAVEGDLRTRVHHEAGPIGHQCQLAIGLERPAELQQNQDDDQHAQQDEMIPPNL